MAKTEAQTRTEVIDNLLGKSGWNVKDPAQVVEEYVIPTALPEGVSAPRTTYDGHQFADYVLRAKASAAARANMNIENLRPLKIISPPSGERSKFSAISTKVERLTFHNQQSLTYLENLYGALGRQAFKGELDLSYITLNCEGQESRMEVSS